MTSPKTGGAGSENDDDLILSESDRMDEGGYGGVKGGLSPVSEYPEEEEEGEYYDEMLGDMMESGVPAPPDGGWGWVIVFASFMCNLIVDGIAYTFGVFIGEFTESFVGPGESKGKVAWVGSLLSGVYLSVGPIVSALTNKFGCRIVCICGSIIASIGFALSTLSPSLDVLMITYGVIGGIGFGLIYLPAVVCVGYYFETKRALATGIAVCGSGVGTFIFAPFARFLLDNLESWRSANLIFAGLIFSCAVFGALMKPLEIRREPLQDDFSENPEKQPKSKPLLLRMAEDKRNQMEKGSLAGSAYFMVQLPDGTMERRMKMPLNVDPGVHSSFNLDQLVPGTPITNPTLPTITEIKLVESPSTISGDSSSGGTKSPVSSPIATREVNDNDINEEEGEGEGESRPLMSTTPAIAIPLPDSITEERETDESFDSVQDSQRSPSAMSPSRRIIRDRRNSEGPSLSSPSSGRGGSEMFGRSPPRPIIPPSSLGVKTSGPVVIPTPGRGIPRNGSAPQFTHGRPIPKNGSVPQFAIAGRKHSYRAVPIGSMPRPMSKSNLSDSRRGSGSNQFKTSMTSFLSTNKNNNLGTQDDDYNSLWSRGELSEGLIFSTSRRGSHVEPRHIIRPLSRKDIFYSGSIAQLPEYQSQKSINSYRQSVLNLPRVESGVGWKQGGDEGDGSPAKTPPLLCPYFSTGAFKSAISQLMDFTLLKNPVFLLIAVSNVFGMLGFYVPFVYIIQSAKEKGVDGDSAAFLLSIIGITNTIGRVASGLVSDLPQVNSLFLNNMCILLSGLCVASVPFCPNYPSYIIVSIFFGLFVSGYVSLTSIILVDLLGLDNLTNAFGLLILFRGGASIVGAPLAGAVYDAFLSFDIPFYLAGGFLIISAFISFLVPLAVKYAPEKKILQPYAPPSAYLEDIPEVAESTQNNSRELSTKENQSESAV